MKFLKIYTKDMILIDEVYTYSGLTYTKGLNTIDTMTFNIPLNSPNCNPNTLEFMNKIEYVEVKMIGGREITRLIWEGIIVERTFDASQVSVGCYSRLFLLSKRRVKHNKLYEDAKIHEIVKYIVDDCNSDIKTSEELNGTLVLGDLDTTKVTAQRDIKDTDMALDSIVSLVESKGFYVDCEGGYINFKTSYGEYKPNYTLQFTISGEGDNLLRLPQLNQTITDTTNDVYGRVDWEEEVEVPEGEEPKDPIQHTLKSNRVNDKSINMYGILEGAVDIHDSTRILNTLNSALDKELEVSSYPINTIDVEARDTWLCPFDDVNVGDRVTLSLEPYFGFSSEVRILEMEYNDETKVYRLTLGNTVFKTDKPKYRLYSKQDVAKSSNVYKEKELTQ